MKKALIFGAGGFGSYYLNHQNKYNILAVVDNNPQKEGSYIDGVEVILPKNISQYEYEYIVIASTFSQEIHQQLIEMGIPEESIILPSKRELKKNTNAFEKIETRTMAKQVLVRLCKELDRLNLSYWIDYGTLLGIVRDKDLIHWDDDLDIKILKSELPKLLEHIDDIVLIMNLPEVRWSYHVNTHYTGKLHSISFIVQEKDDTISDFNIDLYLYEVDKELDENHPLTRSAPYYLKENRIEFEGYLFNAPNNVEDYLKLWYGDWEKPKKDVQIIL